MCLCVCLFVCLSVCLSVTALAASVRICSSCSRYTRVSRRLFLGFDSWIFEKLYRSRVMAEKRQYENFLSSPPAVLAYFRDQSGAGPTSPTTFQYTAVSYWRKGPKTTEIQSGDQTAILLVYSLWTGIARERLMIRTCKAAECESQHSENCTFVHLDTEMGLKSSKRVYS